MENKASTANANAKMDDAVGDGSGEIVVDEVSGGGIFIDKSGHKWTIPEDTFGEMQLYKSPFDIPNRDPGLHYQFEEELVISQLMTEGFVPVTRKELGLPDFGAVAEYGQNQDSYYKVGTQVCVKLPLVLAKRRYAAAKRLADSARDATEPPPPKDEKEKAAREGAKYGKGGKPKFDLKHEAIHVKPRNEANEKVSATE